MGKNQNDHRSQQSDSKSTAEKKRENTQKKHGNLLLPNKPEKNIPVKADLDNRRTIKNRPHPH